MSIEVGKGRAQVTISGPLADGLEAELRELLQPVIDQLERETQGILDGEVAPNWPRKTGRSARSWRRTLRLVPGELAVESIMISDEAYTRYIKSTKVGDRDEATRIRSPLVAHVRKPATVARRRLRKILPAVIGEHLDKVLGDG